MSGPTPYLGRHQLLPLATVAPYGLLAALVLVTVLNEPPGRGLVVDMSLCGVAALWMLWMVTVHPAWLDRPKRVAVFFVGLLAITAVLVVRHQWFGFLTPASYFYAFRFLPWPWRLPAVASVAVVAATAQVGNPDATVAGLAIYVAVILANALPLCGLAWVVNLSNQHDDERERALREVSEANTRLAASLAENAGLHRQLVAQAREAGVQDERQRMAREIHDTLAQGLTGIITQLQAAEQAGDDPAAWHRHVRAATTLARESLTEARRSVDALRPRQLETARLSEALADVAERWSVLHGVDVRVTTTGTARPMPQEAESALLRIAQEALANVAKHAQATRVGVTLSYMDHEVALDVRDDGRGFDPNAPRRDSGGGFGLVAMRQRIENLSGTLEVESEPGGGTGISACVPAGAPA
jgi:signal transduction histidine kinase